MKADEFYLNEYKGLFHGDPVIKSAAFRFAEAYAEQKNKELRAEIEKMHQYIQENCK